MTVRGERARFLGAEGSTQVGFRQVRNIDSDTYFTATMDDRALAAAHEDQPLTAIAIRMLISEMVTSVSMRVEP